MHNINLPISRPRITSIDFLRGTIMIIMALDHVRDYLYTGSFLFDPLDLGKTSGVLFFTRWITHFCAPVFMLLAGTSACLTGRKKTKGELSAFLLKRGLWLIFLEMVVVNFGFSFNPFFPMFLFFTIWALGISMIVLAGLIYLPNKWILVFSILLIGCHDLFDHFQPSGAGLSAFGWALLHKQQLFSWHKEIFMVGYPVIPLIAIMPLGYCLGQLYASDYDGQRRKKILILIGFSAIGLFVVLRGFNFYGDPVRWTAQKNIFFTFLSFLKVNKYPPSLLYCLITLGPALLFLAYTEKLQNRLTNAVSVFGRVPMFYYLIHIYIIHILAMSAGALTMGQDWTRWILSKPIWFSEGLKGYGFSLPVTYLIWVLIVIFLYPFCSLYDEYKQSHKDKWWLSYL